MDGGLRSTQRRLQREQEPKSLFVFSSGRGASMSLWEVTQWLNRLTLFRGGTAKGPTCALCPPAAFFLKTTAKLAASSAFALNRATLARANLLGDAATGTLPEVDVVLRTAVSAEDVPGVVAMAATEAGVVYEGVFGSRRLREGPPMTRDTIFRIASMVKLITSVAALRLVEQGKLSLEAPVPNIDPVIAAPQVLDGFDPTGKPVLRPAKRPITLHDLLTHTAGFVYRLWDADAVRYYRAIDKLPIAYRSQLPRNPLMFDPGERWQYGGNIDWVGRIVQAVSGEPLDAHFRKHIFEPLGMNDTGCVAR